MGNSLLSKTTAYEKSTAPWSDSSSNNASWCVKEIGVSYVIPEGVVVTNVSCSAYVYDHDDGGGWPTVTSYLYANGSQIATGGKSEPAYKGQTKYSSCSRSGSWEAGTTLSAWGIQEDWAKGFPAGVTISLSGTQEIKVPKTFTKYIIAD